MAAANNRHAAYHCPQAAEKLIKAVLLHRNRESGLPDSDSWKAKLRPLDVYSPYATTYRYPTPGGRIAPAPDMARVVADASVIDDLIKEARTSLR